MMWLMKYVKMMNIVPFKVLPSLLHDAIKISHWENIFCGKYDRNWYDPMARLHLDSVKDATI